MASLFSFGGQPVDVEIKLAGEDDRRQAEVKGEKDKKEMCPVYYDGESVVGQVSERWAECKVYTACSAAPMVICWTFLSDVRYTETDSATQVNVRVKDGKKFVHDGIRIELIGSIGRLLQPIPE